MPSARGEEDIVDRLGSPGSGLVGVDGDGVAEDLFDDPPSFLDDILTGEEALIPLDGVADETLVRGHLVGLLVDDLQLHRLSDHPLPVDLHLHADADLDAG